MCICLLFSFTACKSNTAEESSKYVLNFYGNALFVKYNNISVNVSLSSENSETVILCKSETSKALENIKCRFKNNVCEIISNGIFSVKPLINLENDFLPYLIYRIAGSLNGTETVLNATGEYKYCKITFENYFLFIKITQSENNGEYYYLEIT